MRVFALLALTSVLVTGCGTNEISAMVIDGDSDHSLTLVRDKPHAWSKGWDLAVVVARMPSCQRRHHLKHMGDGDFRVEVFRNSEYLWVLNQGKRWYVADTESCELQQFESPPADPGVSEGVFLDRGGQLAFKPASNSGK